MLATAALPTLSSSAAAALDAVLLSPRVGFTLSALVECAGLSVATAIAAAFPAASHARAIVVCGPGNNGLDGLVAARWLAAFRYTPTVVLPRRSRAQPALAEAALAALAAAGVPVLAAVPPLAGGGADLLVDALFGFSAAGAPREPYAAALDAMVAAQRRGGNGSAAAAALEATGDGGSSGGGGIPVVSVDIPSGWEVDGAVAGALRPEMLISLTAPKPCAAAFAGQHYIAGRFVPREVAREFGIEPLTELYAGSELVVRVR